MDDAPRITYAAREDATPEGEIAALAAVYAYLINTHNSEKAAECNATSDDLNGSAKIRTRNKEAT